MGPNSWLLFSLLLGQAFLRCLRSSTLLDRVSLTYSAGISEPDNTDDYNRTSTREYSPEGCPKPIHKLAFLF